MVTRKYKALIEQFPLVPIRNEEHLDAAHLIAQGLMCRECAQDEADYLEVLLTEIGRYESKHHDLQHQYLPPHLVLQSFMKDHQVKQVALQEILKVSSGVMSELVSGKRELTKEHCVRLGAHFKVSPALFLPRAVAS